MYEEIRKGNDVVIGSRYMEGGGIKKWPLKRRIISVGATFLGRLLFPDVTDPVSGFFAIRKDVVLNAPLKPKGYKILLEVLGKGTWEKDKEIPFEFVDREIGTSKLKIRIIIEYAVQVMDITLYSFFHHHSAAWREWKKLLKFGMVGISGILVNMGVLYYLKEYAGFYYLAASFFAIELSILNNFLWNDLWTFRSSGDHKLSRACHQYGDTLAPHQHFRRILSFLQSSRDPDCVWLEFLSEPAYYVDTDLISYPTIPVVK
jgi:dolichol-phosphate mannosyltransferase